MTENLHSPNDDANVPPKNPSTQAIDWSIRYPVIILFSGAIHWLIVASFLSFVLSIKLIAPDFLGGISFLSYGRIAPIARNLMLYGWASQAAIASVIWLMRGLCSRFFTEGNRGYLMKILIINATILWNLVIFLGTLSIFSGYSTGVEWLEYPNWASSMLLFVFLFIAIWLLLLFYRLPSRIIQVADWYLIAGLCSFPWLYGTANMLLTWKPIQASAQGPIQAWFCGGFLGIWLLPIAVASLNALIPMILGKSLHHRNLAPLGFWGLLFLGGWSGIDRLIGGPIPAWLSAVGVVTGILFIIPVIIIAMNLIGSFHAGTFKQNDQIVLRFIKTGLYLLIILASVGLIASMPGINGALNLTGFTEAKYQLWILGAISFPILAVLYYSLPTLIAPNCWNTMLAEWHYMIMIVGISLLVVMLLLGGLFTGLALNDPSITFLNVTSYAYPFHLVKCVATLLLLVGAFILGLNFIIALTRNHLLRRG